jgi:hypothetical protein
MKNIIFPISALALIILAFTNRIYKEETKHIINVEINVVDQKLKDVKQDLKEVEQDLKNIDVIEKENILKNNETTLINGVKSVAQGLYKFSTYLNDADDDDYYINADKTFRILHKNEK